MEFISTSLCQNVQTDTWGMCPTSSGWVLIYRNTPKRHNKSKPKYNLDPDLNCLENGKMSPDVLFYFFIYFVLSFTFRFVQTNPKGTAFKWMCSSLYKYDCYTSACTANVQHLQVLLSMYIYIWLYICVFFCVMRPEGYTEVGSSWYRLLAWWWCWGARRWGTGSSAGSESPLYVHTPCHGG